MANAAALTDAEAVLARRPESVGRMFLDRVAETPGREAFRHRVGTEWRSLTWAAAADRVRAIAAGLLALGVAREQRVAIASSTRLEWVLADLGVMCAGAATTTIYPSTPHEDVAHILADSDSRVVFVEDAEQLEKIRSAADRLATPPTLVVLDGTPGGPTGTADGERTLTLAELEQRGREQLRDQPGCVDAAVAAVGREHLATLMYTSGTTGRPKGVRLTHGCWTYEGVAIAALDLVRPDDLQYLWLPLSHSFGKVLITAQLAVGFTTAIDGDVDRLVENLAVIKPTFMGAAPRIFEKVHGRVIRTAQSEGAAKYKVFTWAFRVGGQVAELRREGRTPPRRLAAQHALADRLVFAKLRARFGGRLRFFVSGSAALSREVAEFFHTAGILILEGYGLTETSAGTTVNLPGRYRFGTVGMPLPGTEVRIAGDGEVLVRGPGVMSAYHGPQGPDEQVLDAGGWFHTGDIGELEDGFLRITDRKKDLIKTSGGKYVAPQAIELAFKATCPYAGHILVHGERRNFCSALISLDPDAVASWADQHGMSGKPYEDIVGSEAARAMVQGYVDQLNAKLARWETIKRFALLPQDFSIESGELTPSLKVRRSAVERRYRDVLDELYADA